MSDGTFFRRRASENAVNAKFGEVFSVGREAALRAGPNAPNDGGRAGWDG